jgi:hypothetical protein
MRIFSKKTYISIGILLLLAVLGLWVSKLGSRTTVTQEVRLPDYFLSETSAMQEDLELYKNVNRGFEIIVPKELDAQTLVQTIYKGEEQPFEEAMDVILTKATAKTINTHEELSMSLKALLGDEYRVSVIEIKNDNNSSVFHFKYSLCGGSAGYPSACLVTFVQNDNYPNRIYILHLDNRVLFHKIPSRMLSNVAGLDGLIMRGELWEDSKHKAFIEGEYFVSSFRIFEASNSPYPLLEKSKGIPLGHELVSVLPQENVISTPHDLGSACNLIATNPGTDEQGYDFSQIEFKFKRVRDTWSPRKHWIDECEYEDIKDVKSVSFSNKDIFVAQSFLEVKEHLERSVVEKELAETSGKLVSTNHTSRLWDGILSIREGTSRMYSTPELLRIVWASQDATSFVVVTNTERPPSNKLKVYVYDYVYEKRWMSNSDRRPNQYDMLDVEGYWLENEYVAELEVDSRYNDGIISVTNYDREGKNLVLGLLSPHCPRRCYEDSVEVALAN